MNSQLSPVHRLIGGVLVLMVLTFGLWATFGQIDIVVQAQGKLVPESAVKVSQPAEAGPVVEVLVHDGQRVRAGDVLLRLDSTQPSRDADALRSEARLTDARVAAIQASLMGQAVATKEPVVNQEFQLRLAAFKEAQQVAQAAVQRAEGELASSKEALAKQVRTLELASSAETAHANLKREGFVSEMSYQDKLKERIEREQDARSLRATVAANEAAVAQAKASLSSVTSDLFKQLAQERTQALTQQEHTKAELAKAEHRTQLTEIRAPVDGVVNGLTVRTAGQVVAAGAVLLSIVPDAEALVTEAWLRNDDVGFVSPGMPAKVKLATYPFQKYGWLTGEVASIGADSEVPESMRNAQGEPLFYKVRVKLTAQALVRDGKRFPAKSGMQAVADIQLGERTLLEYLTSPLKKAVLEAARER